MSDFLNKFTLKIGDKSETAFLRKNGIAQDGTTPMCRDTDGKLWAMSGHSHVGHIGVFSGTNVSDLKEMWQAQTNFCVGHADFAFDKIRYPDGTKSRGSIWPMGLYICPKTHRFFCFFHNETGWNGKGTAYDAYGYCDVPHYDFDFRHIGLMHSDDEGKNWTFDRWVLTAEQPAFTQIFKPEEAGVAIGQAAGDMTMGSGDFTLFDNPNDEYLYLVYNIAQVNTDECRWKSIDTYIARTRKRDDGIMGDFVKLYNGEWCEAGNFGKESIIANNAWHSKIVFLEKHNVYLMTSSRFGIKDDGTFGSTLKVDLRTSTDLIHWSDPVGGVMYEGKEFGNHYVALAPTESDGHMYCIKGDSCCFLTNHNATDVMRYEVEIVEK